MPIKQLTLMCPTCDALMPHNQDRANHIVHGLLTLFTAGLYLPIWIIVAIGDKAPAVCVKCGSKREDVQPAQVDDVSAKTKLVIFGACALLLGAVIAYAAATGTL